MKRLVASRKLKMNCIYCNKGFRKGDVYYKDRHVNVEFDEINFKNYVYGYTIHVCPRCKYKQEQHSIRFKNFKEKCIHPEKFISEEWSYIPGECVKQPDHFECTLCGKIL